MNGKEFKIRRVAKFIPQDELSIIADIPLATIDAYENEIIKPNKEVLTKLLYALHNTKPTLG